MSQQQASVGRVIHYVLEKGRSAGQHRPGIVVNTFNDPAPLRINARIFLDSSNDAGNEFGTDLEGHTFSCPRDDEGKQPGSWHFPEFVPNK